MTKTLLPFIFTFMLGIALGVTLMLIIIYQVWLAPLPSEIIIPNMLIA